jgi:hypothetical protein
MTTLTSIRKVPTWIRSPVPISDIRLNPSNVSAIPTISTEPYNDLLKAIPRFSSSGSGERK